MQLTILVSCILQPFLRETYIYYWGVCLKHCGDIRLELTFGDLGNSLVKILVI